MNFQPGNLYHIYNRGNNRQLVFFNPENYELFISKLASEIGSCCEILAYCLMPNHFHIMIKATEKTILVPEKNYISKTQLGEGMRVLLSSYARKINKQEKRTGSLFTQNTQAKVLSDWSANYNYAEYCFYYIHRNPFKGMLVDKLEDWPYSSYNDYLNLDRPSICRRDLAHRELNIDWDNFKAFSEGYQNEDIFIRNIF
jgi:putative transposase